MLMAAAWAAGGDSSVPPETANVGVNLAGAEFGKLPGMAGRDYGYPGPQQFDYCKSSNTFWPR